jgi:branched-subunit amino acid aminotransferase/4-amino-4-deoxychorismate lyase
MFLTGTTIEVLPVVKLDGKKMGTGRPGKQAKLLQKLFQNARLEDGGK